METKFRKFKMRTPVFYFLLPKYSRESIYLGSFFFKLIFATFRCFKVPWIQKSRMQLLVCVYVFIWVRNISIAQKEMIPKISKLVVYIFIVQICYLKLFVKSEQIVMLKVTKNSNALLSMDLISCSRLIMVQDFFPLKILERNI